MYREEVSVGFTNSYQTIIICVCLNTYTEVLLYCTVL